MTLSIPSARTDRQSTVLVVDDQAPSRELLLSYLEGLPCEVRQAANGESALAAIAEAPPDLILLDVMMPGLNGFAVTQRVKSNPETATIAGLAGLTVIEDQCMKIEYGRLGGELAWNGINTRVITSRRGRALG